VLGWSDAHSTEIDAGTHYPVIGLITEWLDDRHVEQRAAGDDLGGTMRLGEQLCQSGTRHPGAACYGARTSASATAIAFEVNNNLPSAAGRARPGSVRSIGGRRAGRDDRAADHPWFLACQFHPEFTSSPRDGHPLFTGFVRAALAQASSTRFRRKVTRQVQENHATR
jgi:CTP synthase